MKTLGATSLMIFLVLCCAVQTRAQAPTQAQIFAPGKYCCKTPETGYVGCIIFKSHANKGVSPGESKILS
jgi:hypothetical protein